MSDYSSSYNLGGDSVSIYTINQNKSKGYFFCLNVDFLYMRAENTVLLIWQFDI